MRLLLFTLLALITASPLPLSAETQVGEGNELVVSAGVAVQEIPAASADEIPLVAVGSAEGYHHLFDPNLCALQSLWRGKFGRMDEDGKFVAELSQAKGFSLRAKPWSFGEGKTRRTLKYEWQGHEERDGKVLFRYQLSDPQSELSWQVEESLQVLSEEAQEIHFSIVPSAVNKDLHLNYWLAQTDFRKLSTNGQANQRNQIKNLFPDQRQFTIAFLRRREAAVFPDGYTAKSLPIPAPALPRRFEPTAFDFAADGTCYVSTRTGGVWSWDGKAWTLFAEGLHEANGVHVDPNGAGVYVMQKPELTLLHDSDADGLADDYQSIETRFRFDGTYHEFAYGPCADSTGNLYFSLGLQSHGQHIPAPDGYPYQMGTPTGYRGWMMRHAPDGSLTPFASGLRSPAGIGINAQDEIFITDNQGDFVPSSYLGHVEQGDFLGHPASEWDRPSAGLTPAVLSYEDDEAVKSVPPLDLDAVMETRKLPAVWLAHGDLTNSPGHPAFAPEQGFGPFGGQAFIADIAHRNIVRVALEKIDGQYQGAVFPFIRPLQSAAYSTAFDRQGHLWVGSVGRGWTAGDPAIEVIAFDPAAAPFEIHRIALSKTGFEIHFTAALADDILPSPEDIAIKEYRYRYWDGYGSEPIDEADLKVATTSLAADRKRLSIELPRKAGFIYQIDLPEWHSADGIPLLNNYGHYTLNRLLP